MGKRRRAHGEGISRYVALEHWFMRTDAWRNLNCVGRCAYIEIKSRYAGSNNGRIPYSVQEMAKALNVGKATALRAFRELQEKGFIVLVKRGGFSLKTRHASEWRLTQHSCNVTGNLPSKEFARWLASEKQNAVPRQNPNGCSDETERVS